MIDVPYLIATGRLPPKGGDNSLPRLRDDKVARRVVSGLQQALNNVVPAREAIILTISAPVLSPAATVEALDHRLRGEITSPSPERNFRERVLGNDVHVRILNDCQVGTPKVLAIVCNPAPSPIGLLDLIEAHLTKRVTSEPEAGCDLVVETDFMQASQRAPAANKEAADAALASGSASSSCA